MIQRLMCKLWQSETVSRIGMALLYPIRRIFEPPDRLISPYVEENYIVADLGCAAGYYTFALAKLVGPKGKVYAVDYNKKNIRGIRKKAEKGNHYNIEPYASSAADLTFIDDRSVDLVFASGLL